MKITELTRQALKTRRDRRGMLADGWEFVGENGGRLWTLYRGSRMNHVISDVRISACGRGLWIKTVEDGTPFRGATGKGR